MKKLFLTVAAVVMIFATSCNKEYINGAEEPAADNEFICVIDKNANPQNAPAFDDGMSTKAHIDANNNVWWQATDEDAGFTGDQIAYYGQEVVNGIAQPADYHTLTCTKTSDNKAYFSDPNKHFGQGEHMAYYPASLVVNNVLTLPSDINIDPDRNAGFLPMYGYGNGSHHLTFYNICAVLKIAVPSNITTCNQIVLSATEPIAGPFTMSETKAVLASSGTSTSITVNAPSGTVFSGTVYVAIPENNTNGYSNFTVDFKNGSTSLLTKTNPNTMKVEAGKMYPVTLTTSPVVPNDCFRFTALSTNTSNVSIQLNQQGNVPTYSMEYFKPGLSNWTSYTIGTGISLAPGDTVYFRNSISDTDEHPISSGENDYSYFSTTGNGYVEVSGNIMYLLYNTNPPSYFNSAYSFAAIFYGMTGLESAWDLILPEHITNYCYYKMFYNCTALTSAPMLNASVLYEGCYSHMFSGCTSLMSAPTLDAPQLESSCYESMFSGCTSLMSAPALNANELNNSCYKGMFSGCTSLTESPVLSAWTLADDCYKSMFENCWNLTTVTMLTPINSSSDLGYFDNWLMGAGTVESTIYVYDASTQSLFANCEDSGIKPDNWSVTTYY